MVVCIYIFCHRIREKQLRESYILKYGDKVKGTKSSSNESLMYTVQHVGHTKTHVDVTVLLAQTMCKLEQSQISQNLTTSLDLSLQTFCVNCL